MSRPRRWIGRMALVAIAGCSDAERPRHVTKYLEVELYDDEVICAGTLAVMDAQVERIAAFLAVELPPLITVHYGPSAVDRYCGERWNGCARATGVYANDDSIFHELIHAIRYHQGGTGIGTWLFEEGFAEVMSGYRWDPYYVGERASDLERGPALLADLPRGKGNFVAEDYPTAGHFVSWLRATHGDAALVAFLNDERYLAGEGYHEAFEAHFGRSIADADVAWRAALTNEYTWSEPCDPAYALTWEGATLELTDTVDCEAPHTVGPREYGFVTLRSHCFTLEQPATARVELITEGGFARLSPVGCVDTGELAADYYDYKSLQGGDALELPFAACTWEVQVDGVAKYPRDFTLRLTQL